MNTSLRGSRKGEGKDGSERPTKGRAEAPAHWLSGAETRHPTRSGEGTGRPFLMHLERLCRLISMGQTFTVEFHPALTGTGELRGKVIRHLGLHIMDGGDVAIQLLDAETTIMVGLNLANYKRAWRVWQNGVPSDAQCRATEWR